MSNDGPQSDDDPADRRCLESFVVNNFELEKLEEILAQFNLFDAIGAVRVELRHSDFLSFLLDPNATHGLADAFLQRLLQTVILNAGEKALGINPIDLDVWDLNDTLVLREWENIDILLLNTTCKFVVAIENKVLAKEHSSQLRRYRETLAKHHPQLTPKRLHITHGCFGDTS